MKGTLTVRPVSANLQHDLRTFTKMSPYCFFRMQNQSGTTTSCKGAGKRPVWTDRGIQLRQANGFNSFNIRFEVVDQQNSEDVLIGISEINIRDYLDMSKVSSQNITTHLTKKNSYEGELNVEIKWQPLIQRNTRPPVMTVSQGPRLYVGFQHEQVQTVNQMANSKQAANSQQSNNNQGINKQPTIIQSTQQKQKRQSQNQQRSQQNPIASNQHLNKQQPSQQQYNQQPNQLQPPSYQHPHLQLYHQFPYNQPIPHTQQYNYQLNKPPSYNQPSLPFSQYMNQSLPITKKTYTPQEMDLLLDD